MLTKGPTYLTLTGARTPKPISPTYLSHEITHSVLDGSNESRKKGQC